MTERATDRGILTTLALLAAGGGLIYLLSPVLGPFLAAFLLSYVFEPGVDRLTRLRLPRWLAVTAVFALIVLILVAAVTALLPLIERQVSGFVTRLPGYLDWASTVLLPRVADWTGGLVALDATELRQMVLAHWQELAGYLRTAALGITRSSLGLVGIAMAMVLTPIVTFYLMLDWNKVFPAVLRLFPSAAQPRVRRLARETDAVLSSFLRGQLTVMASLAFVYSAGLMMVGLDLALPLGLLAGLVSFVPYLGFLTGIVSAGIAAYLQFQDPSMLIWVAAVFLAGQLLEGLWLTPRLVGSQIGLHPVAVIFAVMAGGQLFGFLGVLLALPAAAVLKVWLAHFAELHDAPAPARAGVRRARRS